MKILSPAGNLESLKMAVANGADEVYLGINDFNARNNIDGFTTDTLKEAVDFAHLFNVKVFLAINILFADDEFERAVNTLLTAYNLGVDAFIVQDIGLATFIKKTYPQIELHASTQLGIHNLEGVRVAEKIGFKRVVLSRETPLSEIKRIRENSDVEIEYFVQGALCVSFSGNCYLSSYLHDASGNRGKCKQLCRLPYTLKLKDKTVKKGYLLSAKDFNMSERLADLEKAGVTSLKIEGRARRPYYVAVATRYYRNALDGKPLDQNQLALAFNRGYSEGYFNGNSGIISKNQSHLGIYIGKVTKVINGKKFNQVFFTSNKDLSPKSTFKFFDGEKEITTLTAFDLKKRGNEWELTTTQKLIIGLSVRLITDAREEEKTLSLTIKRPLIIELYLKENKPISANVTVNGKTLTVQGEVCQKATQSPITEQNVRECFAKSDYFAPNINVKVFDSVFIAKSKLNEFRRKTYELVYNTLTQTNREELTKTTLPTISRVQKFTDFVVVERLDEPFNGKNVVYSPQTYLESDTEKFISSCKRQGKIPYLDTPNFALKEDIEKLKSIVEKTGIGIVANNLYALNLCSNVVIGWGLNVYNHYTANYFNTPCVTAESQISTRVTAPYMTLRHCPIKEHVGGSCDKCLYKDGYEYVMDDGKRLKLKRKKLRSCTFYLTD